MLGDIQEVDTKEISANPRDLGVIHREMVVTARSWPKPRDRLFEDWSLGIICVYIGE